MDDEKKNNSKFRNYIILSVIFCLVIGLTLYLCQWYKVYDNSKKEIPIIRNTLYEIMQDELDHYVVENQSKVIYMCTSDADVCRNFERDLIKFLHRNDYYNEIIYLNLTNVNQDDFVKSFNDKYKFKVKLTTNYPAFVIFKDGKVDAILQGSVENPLYISKLKNFLELNQIGE